MSSDCDVFIPWFEILSMDPRTTCCGSFFRCNDDLSISKIFLSSRLSLPIPEAIGSLKRLEVLSLSNVDLTGPLPSSLSKLTTLKTLMITENRNLNGPIPDLSGLTQLTYLDLNLNALTGQIPPGVLNLPNLATIDISNNKLSGSLSFTSKSISSLSVGMNCFSQESISSAGAVVQGSTQQLPAAQCAAVITPTTSPISTSAVSKTTDNSSTVIQSSGQSSVGPTPSASLSASSLDTSQQSQLASITSNSPNQSNFTTQIVVETSIINNTQVVVTRQIIQSSTGDGNISPSGASSADVSGSSSSNLMRILIISGAVLIATILLIALAVVRHRRRARKHVDDGLVTIESAEAASTSTSTSTSEVSTAEQSRDDPTETPAYHSIFNKDSVLLQMDVKTGPELQVSESNENTKETIATSDGSVEPRHPESSAEATKDGDKVLSKNNLERSNTTSDLKYLVLPDVDEIIPPKPTNPEPSKPEVSTSPGDVQPQSSSSSPPSPAGSSSMNESLSSSSNPIPHGPFHPSEIETWDSDKVAEALRSFGVSSQIISMLKESNVDGKEFLKLDHERLQTIGIEMFSARAGVLAMRELMTGVSDVDKPPTYLDSKVATIAVALLVTVTTYLTWMTLHQRSRHHPNLPTTPDLAFPDTSPFPSIPHLPLFANEEQARLFMPPEGYETALSASQKILPLIDGNQPAESNPTFAYAPGSMKALKDPLDHRRIPRLIHITVPDKNRIPWTVQRNIESWSLYNPDFQVYFVMPPMNTDVQKVIVHDDKDMLKLVKDVAEPLFPGFLSIFLGFKKNVERADFWRYLILFLHGGVYADSDVEPMEPILKWIKRFQKDNETLNPFARYRDPTSRQPENRNGSVLIDAIVGIEAGLSPEESLRQGYTFHIQWCQWTFAFRRQHPLLRAVLLTIQRTVHAEGGLVKGVSLEAPMRARWRAEDKKEVDGAILFRTGPGMFSVAVRVWLDVQSRLALMDSDGGVEDDGHARDMIRGVTGGESRQKLVSTLTYFMKRSLLGNVDLGDLPPYLESQHVSQGYHVVGGVALLPQYAFGYREGADKAPGDISEILVKHDFAGSWKGK
ncbi:membrane-bound alpha-1,6- mannosyltransferase Initiation-specific [Phlyctochytrium planicorne]|nr:membrane-bound alpha-1,6- mannosyltransferase Initiation-specific [Phlyctochytrium planicorne]